MTPLDVLLIVNEINANGPQDLAQVNFQAPPFVDVNGDGFCTALDALLVINFINDRAAGEGEASGQEEVWTESLDWLAPSAEDLELLTWSRTRRR